MSHCLVNPIGVPCPEKKRDIETIPDVEIKHFKTPGGLAADSTIMCEAGDVVGLNVIHDVAPLPFLSTHFANPHPALASYLHLAVLHQQVDLIVELLQFNALTFFCCCNTLLKFLNESTIHITTQGFFFNACLCPLLVFLRPSPLNLSEILRKILIFLLQAL